MNHRLLLTLVALALTFSSTTVAQRPNRKLAAGSDAEIKSLYQAWAKAFEARDIDGIMAIYAPGDEVIAYDVVPPLQYKGKDAYRKDYVEFLSQYEGSIHVEYQDM